MILALNNCLLTDEEIEHDPDVWAKLPDPFPSWIDANATDA